MEISSMDVSASGLKAQRIRMEMIANNIANIETTSANTEIEKVGANTFVKHVPYRRKNVVFMPGNPSFKERLLSVTVPNVVEDGSDFRKIFDPSHPHAVKNPDSPDFGYVYYPNVNPFVEMTDMMTAVRAYEANATAIENLKSMTESSLRIL
ncbi:MAG: flagellar basal body rod protein FlgC [Planctomycetes bacterium]|nr:flagellar basal body rod protein FlgC [Planctomycetota bacterium]